MTYCHLSSRLDAMYLNSIIILHLIVLTVANPFHKYPYVFLLDVGNEELENTRKEQIRVSSPGGSLAIRYPAIGNGETLTHVRVTGIDFGTDLKSNIVEGGPGYKYVVLVFIGNQGVPYDAVVTVQMLPVDGTEGDDTEKISDVDNSTNRTGNIPDNLIEEDVENAEPEADYSSHFGVVSKNTEVSLQPSSKIYNSDQNLPIEKQGYDDGQTEDNRDYEEQGVETSKGIQYYEKESDQEESANQDDYRHYGEDQVKHQNENKYVSNKKYEGKPISNNYDDNEQYTADQLHKIQNNFGESRQYFIVRDQTQNRNNYGKEQKRNYQHLNDADQVQNENQDSYDSEQQQSENGSPQAKQYIENSDVEDESYDGETPTKEADNNYRNYDALKALLYGYNGVLPEETADDADQNPEAESGQENEELNQSFNDEEVHNDLDRDLNNNQFDRDDESAVAS